MSNQLQTTEPAGERLLKPYAPRRTKGQMNVNFKSKALKYLGVWLDTKLTFEEHLSKSSAKADRTVTELYSLSLKIKGPRSSKRRTSVVHSQIVYAEPTWHKIIENSNRLEKLVKAYIQHYVQG